MGSWWLQRASGYQMIGILLSTLSASYGKVDFEGYVNFDAGAEYKFTISQMERSMLLALTGITLKIPAGYYKMELIQKN
jgi:hypothetical protein